MFLTKSILPLKFFFFFCYLKMFEPAYIKILDWNTAKDKMWNGIGRYGFIGVYNNNIYDWYKSNQLAVGFSIGTTSARERSHCWTRIYSCLLV